MRLLSISLFLIPFFAFAQGEEPVNAFQDRGNVQSDQEAYNGGEEGPQYTRVLIVPFDPKMYMSSLDKDIVKRTGMSFYQIRDNMRYGICAETKNQIKGISAVSLMHVDTSILQQDLHYIYSSIGYKYKVLPQEDLAKAEQIEKENKPVEKIKGSFNKLIKKTDKEEAKEDDPDLPSAEIYEGQIVTHSSSAEKYMNTVIHNPNLLKILGQKYEADVFLFINQLDISDDAKGESVGLSSLVYERRLKMHYTIFDKNGKELYGGAAITHMPMMVTDMNKIVHVYFPRLAQISTGHLPAKHGEFSKKKEQLLEEQKEQMEEKKEETIILH